jgi:hypothetical protein
LREVCLDMFIQVYVLFVFLAGKFADIGIHMDGNQQVREYESVIEKNDSFRNQEGLGITEKGFNRT